MNKIIKKNIHDHGGKHCLTCKGFTNMVMIDHKLWCNIHKKRVLTCCCPDYDLNTDKYFEECLICRAWKEAICSQRKPQRTKCPECGKEFRWGYEEIWTYEEIENE